METVENPSPEWAQFGHSLDFSWNNALFERYDWFSNLGFLKFASYVCFQITSQIECPVRGSSMTILHKYLDKEQNEEGEGRCLQKGERNCASLFFLFSMLRLCFFLGVRLKALPTSRGE
jgi:hypothetical protein